MNKNLLCKNCGVKVSNSLKHCPLCGRFVREFNEKEVQDAQENYPVVDLSYIYIAKWVKIVGGLFILLSIISVFVNLFFKTNPYWFPYVLVGIYAVWRILFYPFKEGKSHISSIPMSGIVAALLVIFIDVYNHLCIGTALGWALCYVAPAIFTATTILSFVLAVINRKKEEVLFKGILLITLVNIAFLVSKLLWFNMFRNWPIFMSLLSSFVAIFLLLLFKRKRLIKEINRSFHI